MRLSPTRLILRALLLVAAAGLVAQRALDDGRRAAGPGHAPGEGAFLTRLSWVEWALSALALLTAAWAVLALRRPPQPRRRHLLRLRDGEPGPDPVQDPAGPAEPSGRPAAPTGHQEPP